MKKRSSFKFHPLRILLFDLFFQVHIFGGGIIKKTPPQLSLRNSTVTPLDVAYTRSVYQGKSLVIFSTTPQHIGYKVGAFTKTRKPFFFRSKKKKK